MYKEFGITVVDHYDPFEAAAKAVKDQFYVRLRFRLYQCRIHDILIVLDDFNATREKNELPRYLGSHGIGERHIVSSKINVLAQFCNSAIHAKTGNLKGSCYDNYEALAEVVASKRVKRRTSEEMKSLLEKGSRMKRDKTDTLECILLRKLIRRKLKEDFETFQF
ncbi:unnamed protein product [Soboliphyme baturini]|uniref:Reverse transcriptase n=1 Tax=Soboliphyme baturini TaxID=241478 RepID=A0A183ITT1_9BILA|nr:unnamed protein product [Soboliphyme baturini]